MPYIGKEIREELDLYIEPLTEFLGEARLYGVWNYVITKILLATNPKCYHDYNALIGILECAKLELYRRRIAPYEEKRRREHGDVYN